VNILKCTSEIGKKMTSIFGAIDYTFTYSYAVEKKYINDYKIIVPSLDISYNKYEYIYHSLLFYGYKKCIVFTPNIEDANKFVNELIKINGNNFSIDISINKIVNTTTKKNRHLILENFRSNKTLSIIVAVYILDECIDIPECDSVYISYDTLPEIRTIQRISRCLRIYEDLDNGYKKQKSGIFLYVTVEKNDANIDPDANINKYVKKVFKQLCSYMGYNENKLETTDITSMTTIKNLLKTELTKEFIDDKNVFEGEFVQKSYYENELKELNNINENECNKYYKLIFNDILNSKNKYFDLEIILDMVNMQKGHLSKLLKEEQFYPKDEHMVDKIKVRAGNGTSTKHIFKISKKTIFGMIMFSKNNNFNKLKQYLIEYLFLIFN